MLEKATSIPPVQRFDTNTGVRIYRVTCQAFPGLLAHVYLLIGAGPPTLVDTGSGYGNSNSQVLSGLASIRGEFDEPIDLADIQRIIITHGHIDHFGGLPLLHERTGAEIAIHELDRRILTAHHERVVVATRALRHFLQQAGVPTALRPALMEMYSFSKKHVPSLPVDVVLRDGTELDGLRFIHVPGHCPGQVCIALDDVLLTADHVLPEITPHQSPESIMPYTGLGHYLESLAKIRAAGEFRLGLGGHGPPITDVVARVGEIEASHQRKLAKILDILRNAGKPLTTNEFSKRLYTRVEGFHVLLALEEVGAHVEYLYEHGELAIANLDEFEQKPSPAVRYTPA